MRKVIASVIGLALVLASATTVLAAKPDDVWRYQETGSGVDDFWSDRCGFEVTLAYRLAFSGVRANSTFHVERMLTGPGGSATQVAHLSFRYPDGFETIEDPDAGTVTEIYREVAKGSIVWTTPDEGVIYRDAGYADVTWQIVYDGNGETMTFSDEVYHGQMPAGDEPIQDLVCEALA